MTNEEVELRLVKAQRSLRVAKTLQDDGDHDFAISHAYYTMFYLAEAFLATEGLILPSHKAVISKFGELFSKTGRVPHRFHRYLIDGQDRRHESDYNPHATFAHADSEREINHAQEFLEFAEKALRPSP